MFGINKERLIQFHFISIYATHCGEFESPFHTCFLRVDDFCVSMEDKEKLHVSPFLVSLSSAMLSWVE